MVSESEPEIQCQIDRDEGQRQQDGHRPVKVFVFVERLFCESDAVEDASRQEQDPLADYIGQDADQRPPRDAERE